MVLEPRIRSPDLPSAPRILSVMLEVIEYQGRLALQALDQFQERLDLAAVDLVDAVAVIVQRPVGYGENLLLRAAALATLICSSSSGRSRTIFRSISRYAFSALASRVTGTCRYVTSGNCR